MKILNLDEAENDVLILEDALTFRLDELDLEYKAEEGEIEEWPSLKHERDRIVGMLVQLGHPASALAAPWEAEE